MGKSLMLLGALLFGAGLLLWIGPRFPFRIGRLPGDLVLRGRNWTFYFPLATCLILSLILTLVSWLLRKR
jgi:membrane protein implicated in regulation of membrane protease activity